MKAKDSKKISLEPVYVMASISQLGYIDSLIQTAEVSNVEYQELIQRSNQDLTEGEAEELIGELLEKQRNAILGGFNYQQGDILRMLSKLK